MIILFQCQQAAPIVPVLLKVLPPVISITAPLLEVKWKVNQVRDEVKDCYKEWPSLFRPTVIAMVPMILVVPMLVPTVAQLRLNSREVIAHYSTKGNTHVVLPMEEWSRPGPDITRAWTTLRIPRLCSRQSCQFGVV